MTETEPARPSEGAGATPRADPETKHWCRAGCTSTRHRSPGQKCAWPYTNCVAVNEYARLRRIEEAARAYVAANEWVESDDSDLTWRELRLALAAAPSRPVEREDPE